MRFQPHPANPKQSTRRRHRAARPQCPPHRPRSPTMSVGSPGSGAYGYPLAHLHNNDTSDPAARNIGPRSAPSTRSYGPPGGGAVELQAYSSARARASGLRAMSPGRTADCLGTGRGMHTSTATAAAPKTHVMGTSRSTTTCRACFPRADAGRLLIQSRIAAKCKTHTPGEGDGCGGEILENCSKNPLLRDGLRTNAPKSTQNDSRTPLPGATSELFVKVGRIDLV